MLNICVILERLVLIPHAKTTLYALMDLPVPESGSSSGSGSTGASDIGQPPRLLLLNVVCLVRRLCPYGRLSRSLTRRCFCSLSARCG